MVGKQENGYMTTKLDISDFKEYAKWGDACSTYGYNIKHTIKKFKGDKIVISWTHMEWFFNRTLWK